MRFRVQFSGCTTWGDDGRAIDVSADRERFHEAWDMLGEEMFLFTVAQHHVMRGDDLRVITGSLEVYQCR